MDKQEYQSLKKFIEDMAKTQDEIWDAKREIPKSQDMELLERWLLHAEKLLGSLEKTVDAFYHASILDRRD